MPGTRFRSMLVVEVRDVAVVLVTMFLIVLAVLIAAAFLLPETSPSERPRDRAGSPQRLPRAPKTA